MWDMDLRQQLSVSGIIRLKKFKVQGLSKFAVPSNSLC